MTLLEFVRKLEARGGTAKEVEVFNPNAYGVWIRGLSLAYTRNSLGIYPYPDSSGPILLDDESVTARASVIEVIQISKSRIVGSVSTRKYSISRIPPTVRLLIHW